MRRHQTKFNVLTSKFNVHITNSSVLVQQCFATGTVQQTMKLLVLLALCGFAAAAPNIGKEITFDFRSETSPQERNILVNLLIRQLIAYVRHVIKYGSIVFGFPPLDPLVLDSYHLTVPAGILNLDVDLRNARMAGLGKFVVHKSVLELSELTFGIDISIPKLDISAEFYDLTGDIFNLLPVYGNGKAVFDIEGFRMQAKLFLKQSEDGKSAIIDRIENAAFQLPSFKSDLSGTIGGGDIDVIVNVLIEEVIIGYINRFQGIISNMSSESLVEFANPLLNQFDTWRYIEMLL